MVNEIDVVFWGKGKREFTHITCIVGNTMIDPGFRMVRFYDVSNIKSILDIKRPGREAYVRVVIRVKRKNIAMGKLWIYNCVSFAKMLTGEKGLIASPYSFYRRIKKRGEVLWDLKL